VLCEKPLALSVEHGREMVDACRAAGVVFRVAFQIRLEEILGRVRDIIQSGALGELRAVMFERIAPLRQHGAWRDDPRQGGVLFDVNNVYVSARNQQLDPNAVLAGWLAALDEATVGEIHLAGHAVVAIEDGAELRVDDHGDHICDAVWSLYELALARLGTRPTLIEWDTRLPALPVLQAEAGRAQQRLDAREQAGYARAS
jgi:predicted dehydrogenase